MENHQHCHHCLGANVTKKGFTGKNKFGKQRYKCRDCKRTFVGDGRSWFVDGATGELAERALLERVSLRGICRILDISLSWLLCYVAKKYGCVPRDLGFRYEPEKVRVGDRVYIKLVDCQADELWSFVYRRKDVKYIWIALHTRTRQVIAVHVGDRSRESAKKLWAEIPDRLKATCFFHTDDWESYRTVIPEERHEYSRSKRYTNHLERFNNTLRQRCSRLVRETLSFSKKLENHVGAIRFFCYHHNLKIQQAQI